MTSLVLFRGLSAFVDALSFRKFFPFFLLVALAPAGVFAQFIDFNDETATRLVLTSVANSDDEEKDFSTADLNNDGLPDVVVVRKEPFSLSSEGAKSDLLLINNGGILEDMTATYAPEMISNPSFARDLVIEDLDGDGWKDIVIANTFDQQPIYYANLGEDGGGNWLGFADETATHLPMLTEFSPFFCAIWAGDIDGEGSPDLYIINYCPGGGGCTARDYLLINDGSGVFTDETAARMGDLRNSAFGTAVQIEDMDNDGDNDLVKISTLFGVAPWNDSGCFVLFNDGTGNFTNWQNVAPFAPYMFEIGDYNGDGMKDIFVVDDGSDYCLIMNSFVVDNSLSMTLTTTASGVGGFGGNVHRADLDNDGDDDIGVADVDVDIPPCNSGRKMAVLENSAGSFTDTYNAAGTNEPWQDNSYDFSWLDINGDGLIDFITGGCSGYGVYMNASCGASAGAADYDLDGIEDSCDPCPTNPDPACTPPTDYPTADLTHNIARQWNEMLLESIRKDFARPTVHARNLWHTSVAMYDAWAAMDGQCTYLLGQTVAGYTCPFSGIPTPADLAAARDTAITFASYRILSHRFQNSPNAALLQQGYDVHMAALGMDPLFTSQDYTTGSAAALGNYIAQCIIDFGLQDGSNEINDYVNQFYLPVNPLLSVDDPGNPNIIDINRWQPLLLDIFIDQSGNEIPGESPEFLSPEWGQVPDFALEESDKTTYNRDGFDYHVYHDPGGPPLHQMDGLGDTELFRWGYTTVINWSSHLDPTDGVMIDISPASNGNRTLPNTFADFPAFYDQLNGGMPSPGHAVNPVTGLPYDPQMVPRGDYARVLAEFWADGPDSETPPGHWFTVANYVSDHPMLEKRYKGEGPILDDMEWDVKLYFVLSGAVHDCAVTSWGMKGWYDYGRPISAIRAMADLGQSSEPASPNYHAGGLPLIPGYIELVQVGDPLAGASNEHVDKIKVYSWKGHKYINNVDTDEAGVDWILAENWEPYQRPSFVTPPFAGYISGHSTFSRAAAEVLTAYTGSAYFPGGLGEFFAPANEFLVFEDGPSVDITLQWATYRDAADESGLSRIWGGIHPPADDVPGRKIGEIIGLDAMAKAHAFFNDDDSDGLCNAYDPACAGDFNQDNLINVADLLVALADYGCLTDCVADLDGDGMVSTSDMLLFLALYGTLCP